MLRKFCLSAATLSVFCVLFSLGDRAQAQQARWVVRAFAYPTNYAAMRISEYEGSDRA